MKKLTQEQKKKKEQNINYRNTDAHTKAIKKYRKSKKYKKTLRKYLQSDLYKENRQAFFLTPKGIEYKRVISIRYIMIRYLEYFSGIKRL